VPAGLDYSLSRREFGDQDWFGATHIVSQYYNVVLADCGHTSLTAWSAVISVSVSHLSRP
jgi:hypothetical protein